MQGDSCGIRTAESDVSTSELIGGTLKPDGTLELDQPPRLEPGRVMVALQSVDAQASSGGLVELLDDIHRGQRSRGFIGRSEEKIESGLREGEEDYEERMNALRSPPEPGSASTNGAD